MVVAEDLRVVFRKGMVRKKFNALDGMSLHVREGDVYALLGPNGAGKSTLMYCMLGLIRPNAGSVRVFGKKPVLGSRMYSDIAYLPEEPHYHLYLTVEEAVKYYCALYGEKLDTSRIDGLLERLGLAEFRKMSLKKCSKGMKQKVGIAQCLVRTPRLLFMDEPTRGLDPLIVRDLRNMLVELNKKGATIIMNSHVMSETEMVANRVAMIKKGRLVAEEDIENLLVHDVERYHVVFSYTGMIPYYLENAATEGNRIRATFPAERFDEFMDFVRSSGVKVYECMHKKRSLEDSFFRVMEGPRTDA